MPKFRVTVNLTMGLDCVIEAEHESDARAIAETISVEEPLDSFICYETDYEVDELTDEEAQQMNFINVYHPDYLN